MGKQNKREIKREQASEDEIQNLKKFIRKKEKQNKVLNELIEDIKQTQNN
ncbi:MAG: hypothetical protein ABFS32_21975 [Bacteroidota bacterium]